ncbi:hypothetical protein M407DRAFT_12396, partial [Tulasnella calospora MUT 4182]
DTWDLLRLLLGRDEGRSEFEPRIERAAGWLGLVLTRAPGSLENKRNSRGPNRGELVLGCLQTQDAFLRLMINHGRSLYQWWKISADISVLGCVRRATLGY